MRVVIAELITLLPSVSQDVLFRSGAVLTRRTDQRHEETLNKEDTIKQGKTNSAQYGSQHPKSCLDAPEMVNNSFAAPACANTVFVGV